MSLDVILLGLAATVDPFMMGVVLVVLSRPHPRRGLGAYLAGAFLASTTVGMALVFGLGRIGFDGPASLPAGWRLGLGLVLLAVAATLWRRLIAPTSGGRFSPAAPGWARRAIERSGAPLAFAVGAVANLPGGYTLLAFAIIADGQPDFAAALGQILLFNAIMLLPAEVPFAVSVLRPERTERVVAALRGVMARRGPALAATVTTIIGLLLTAGAVSDLT